MARRKTDTEIMLAFRDKAKPSQLYFIETLCAERHIKIGVAVNVRARMGKMQMDSPYTLRLIKRIEGAAGMEAEIHERFREACLGGEWFERTDALEDFIASLDGTPYLETHTLTKPSKLPPFRPFPENAQTVRADRVRPGLRNAIFQRRLEPTPQSGNG